MTAAAGRVPVDVEALEIALFRAWPRTFGNRLSWSQPSPEMARAIALHYDSLTSGRTGAAAQQDTASTEPKDVNSVLAAERSRVRLLMEQGSGDGLEDGTFTLPASVAREIVEP